MKVSTERKIIRWMHVILSIPVIGYIYGPVAKIPDAAMMVRIFFFPVIVLSGVVFTEGAFAEKMVPQQIWVTHQFCKKVNKTKQ